jgi:hypothetical protein
MEHALACFPNCLYPIVVLITTLTLCEVLGATCNLFLVPAVSSPAQLMCPILNPRSALYKEPIVDDLHPFHRSRKPFPNPVHFVKTVLSFVDVDSTQHIRLPAWTCLVCRARKQYSPKREENNDVVGRRWWVRVEFPNGLLSYQCYWLRCGNVR